MKSAGIARAIFSIIVIGGAFAAVLLQSPTLGLDLQGGTQITLETKSTDNTKADAEATDRAKTVLQRRVDALGVSEPVLTRSGENRIIVELPGYSDVKKASDQLGRTAQLTVHEVLGVEGGEGQMPGQPQQPEPPSGPQPLPGPLGDEPEMPRGPEMPQQDPGGMMGGGQGGGAPGDAQGGGAYRSTPKAAAETDAKNAGTASSGTASHAANDASGTTTLAADDPSGKPDEGKDDSGKDQKESDKKDAGEKKPKESVIPSENPGEKIRVGPTVIDGDEIQNASGQTDPQQGPGWFVSIDFNGSGGKTWKDVTAKAACKPEGDPTRRIAIVLDGKAISSPQVESSVACGTGIGGGNTIITGGSNGFEKGDAQELGALIKGGALPVPVDLIESRQVGPSLGADAIQASVQAAIIGLILTALFILAVYRLMGLLATIALGCYTLISYALMLAFGATFTLPGLAGFVLAIGMAIDANVLIFERAREEYAERPARGLRTSLANGFKGAWSAIIDSNVTTLLAAVLLFFLAAGPVRGFGVTLSIGVLASMVSALIIARFFTEWAASRKIIGKHPAVTGLHTIGRVRKWLEQRNPDIMKHGRRLLVFSAVTTILAIGGIAVNGLNLGIDFTGGRLIEYSTSKSVDADQARQVINRAGYTDAVVQNAENDNISVRITDLSNEQELQLRDDLSAIGGDVKAESDTNVGPSLGNETAIKGAIALAIALIAQMTYLAIRYKFTFGVSAMVSLLHDVIMVIGIFAWLGKTFDSTFLAAALTVIGLSVNDTVIVFDRVREIWQRYPKDPFPKSVNTAIVHTLPRTVYTSLSTLLILGALAILGGSSLQDFALAMFIGMVVGTYSSTTLASPLAIVLQRRSKTNRPPSRGMTKRATGKKRAQEAGSGAVV